MTACPSDELIAELAEGALSEAERSELEAHVAHCPACASMIAELAKLIAPGDVGTGTRIGRYEIAESLGSGGMGLVVEAWDPVLSRRVAIKIVRPDKPLARERLLAEARALAQLSDPHVLTIHDVIDSDRGICLVTELVDGDTADTWCQRVRPAWPDIRDLYLQIARGLVVVHGRGLLHRDIKPANILVGRDGRARLGDFGLVGDGTAALGGTRGFMPPEQAAGAPIDVRADQFALAMSIIHAAGGKVVPANTRPDELHALGIPTAAAVVLARAIAANPSDRFDRIADLVAALQAPQRRKRWPVVVAAFTAAALAAIVLVATSGRSTVAPIVDAGALAHADPIDAPVRHADPVDAPQPAAAATVTVAPPRKRPPAPVVAIQPTAIAPAAPPAAKSDLEDALRHALSENDATGCADALGKLVAIDASYAKHRPMCEMLAGHCKAAVAMLQPTLGAATSGIVNDYCPADGDIADRRVGRALAQGTRGRTPASCKHRAAWVTTLATNPDDAQLFAVNAVECFAAIGRCPDALVQAGVLAKLRSTTVDAEIARISPGCAH